MVLWLVCVPDLFLASFSAAYNASSPATVTAFGRSAISPTAASLAARTSGIVAVQAAVWESTGEPAARAPTSNSTRSLTAAATFWGTLPR